ncbi:unnamed protein product [Brachionus calyciflorus]|uniref:LRAT domain-containing protein n=1 Tax=Brachionus calyciflorus TaxID=104777 RepID=A0A814JCU1_9BILA|nr:unnamed protein product [Brachionus calyciflorus]
MAFEKKIKESIWGSIVLKSEILKTSKDQKFVLIINKVAWYAVHVFLETDARFENKNKYEPSQVEFRILEQIIKIKVSEHLTLEGAKEKYHKIQKQFSSVGNIWSDLPTWLKETPRLTCLEIKDGKKAIENSDDFFLPGDHIQINRVALKIGFQQSIVYQHSAIYIGNKRVIQISDPENESSKERACVNEADWSKFHCGDTEFRICIPQVKILTQKEIIDAAISKIGFYKGQYNVLWKNCQHFASCCQFGDGFGFLVNLHLLER